MKIDLKPKLRWDRGHRPPYMTRNIHWRQAAPFVFNFETGAVLVHRVKHVHSWIDKESGEVSTAVDYWCGNMGRGTFLHEPPESRIVCERCEAAAIVSGEKSSDDLVGRHVHVGRLRPYRVCCEDRS